MLSFTIRSLRAEKKFAANYKKVLKFVLKCGIIDLCIWCAYGKYAYQR